MVFIPTLSLHKRNRKRKLNVVVKIKNDRLSIGLLSKPVQSHTHKEHIKKSTIYSQTLRLRRVYSEQKISNSMRRILKYCGGFNNLHRNPPLAPFNVVRKERGERKNGKHSKFSNNFCH